MQRYETENERVFFFYLSIEFFQRNTVVILIEFYQFHGGFAAGTLQRIITKGASNESAPFKSVMRGRRILP